MIQWFFFNSNGRRFEENTNLVAEIRTLKIGLEYYMDNIYLTMVLETDSLTDKYLLE